MDLDTGIEQMIAAGTEQDALAQRLIANAEVALVHGTGGYLSTGATLVLGSHAP